MPRTRSSSANGSKERKLTMIKFTFEDGSESYLEHYGVKGMKWHQHIMAKQRVDESELSPDDRRKVEAGKEAVRRFFGRGTGADIVPFYSENDPRNSTSQTVPSTKKSAGRKVRTVRTKPHNTKRRRRIGITAQLTANVPKSLR